MHYYEVWVSSQQYHGKEPLTYEWNQPLVQGQIVIAPMQRNKVLGVVNRQVTKPKFPTKALLRIVGERPLPSHLLSLFNWLQVYYPAPSGLILSLFLPAGLLQSPKSESKQAAPPVQKISPPPLTDEQRQAFETINRTNAQTVLVHGDTGTGKTRLYIELVAAQLANDKSAIVLTPEIGLTPQLAQSLVEAFPGQVMVLHSTLSQAERRDEWLRVLAADKPVVIVGPRSALFSPVRKPGIIIMDESHDSAYKQEQAPYYATTRVAAKLSALTDTKLILGSATPLITDYYALEAKGLPIVRLRKPALTTVQEPSVKVVSLRDRDQFSRSAWLSDPLLAALTNNLDSGAQSLVFLNRRGTARLILCQSCGWQSSCPRCDLPLTYHGDEHRLRCHTCGFTDSTPVSCPDCGSSDILFKTIGTKTLVEELQRHFSTARIRRFDSDTGKADRLEANYEAIRDGDVDILVGTQMLSKGLDLPKLQLVGVVMADTSLNFPDFTAEERTFQMLTQVMGRVGRGHQLTSSVIIQTYHPDSTVIRSAIQKDYEQFYQQQLMERKLYNFPPFTYILKLSCARASRASAQKAAQQLADKLAANTAITIVGPGPAFLEKRQDKYHWQIIVRSKGRQALLDVITGLPANWSYDIDPAHLL